MFSIEINLRVITPSESNSGCFLIFLDDQGNLPKINLETNNDIDKEIEKKLDCFFYQNDIYPLLLTKQFSSIENKNGKVDVFYNFITTTTASKTGSFVLFDKNSIELFRMSNNKSI